MKKIFNIVLALVCSACIFTACQDDNDSNPTLVQPTEFVLNGPAYASSAIMLKESPNFSLRFAWKQPKYTSLNAPLAVNYELQISTSGEFNEATEDATATYISVKDITKTEYSFLASELNSYLVKLNAWDGTTVPTEVINVYVRAKASVGGKCPIESNVINLQIVPYYESTEAASTVIWYLTGSCIGDGSWNANLCEGMVPMCPINGEDYDHETGRGKITWTGWLTSAGFKLRGSLLDSWATQIGQGAAFGSYVLNDGGSGNITVPSDGYYTITLDTRELASVADKGDCSAAITIEPAATEPTEYSVTLAGEFNEWGDEPMKAVNTVAGVHNHDWKYTFTGGGKVKFKIAGTWDTNWGAIDDEHCNDLTGFGVQGGKDIWLEEGTYLIIFNDVTGYYQFIKQ